MITIQQNIFKKWWISLTLSQKIFKVKAINMRFTTKKATTAFYQIKIDDIREKCSRLEEKYET